jgi:hypothetical protein
MQKTLAALSIAAGIGFVCCQTAGAVPASAPAMKEAATAASLTQQAQYAERVTRHGIIKCYREAVIGPYRCHRYGWWVAVPPR